MRTFFLTAIFLPLIYLVTTGFTPYDKYQYFYTAVKTVRLLKSSTAYGSGVVISPGRLAVVAHLFDYNSDGWKVNDGQSERAFTIEYVDPVKDVAVLSVPGLKCPCAPLARSAPGQFSEVFTIGYPVGARIPVLTTGRLQGNYSEYLDLMTASTAAGTSGGPVFTVEDGRAVLIGLVKGGLTQQARVFGNMVIDFPTFYLSVFTPVDLVKQAILCADGLDFDYCALGIPGDDVQ